VRLQEDRAFLCRNIARRPRNRDARSGKKNSPGQSAGPTDRHLKFVTVEKALTDQFGRI